MPRAARSANAVVGEAPGPIYRHLSASNFDPGEWVQDLDCRLVIHTAGCQRPYSAVPCVCDPCDIQPLRRRRRR
jgi:hypothetical protein